MGGSALLWILQASYYRVFNHPWVLAVLVGAALGCYLLWPNDWKQEARNSADPAVFRYRAEDYLNDRR